MVPKIALNKPNSYFLLNGDEAVARGAVEANVKVAASYPGTPATEILETIAEVAKEFGIYAEWSINEIVAMEVAVGASMTGTRSIVSMKHVGLNVAADAAMTLAYTGIPGGLVIVVCDDPAMHSSQNEQDTRYFSVHSNIPLLDAGSPQEAYEMTRDAYELSEKLQLPIIVRLTTRVAHGKARVKVASSSGFKTSRALPLERAFRIGTDPHNAICIPAVGQGFIEIWIRSAKVGHFLEVMFSEAPVLLNQKPVAGARRLAHGDTIQILDYHLVYLAS